MQEDDLESEDYRRLVFKYCRLAMKTLIETEDTKPPLFIQDAGNEFYREACHIHLVMESGIPVEPQIEDENSQQVEGQDEVRRGQGEGGRHRTSRVGTLPWCTRNNQRC